MSLTADIPRFSLGHWPTPLEELPRFSEAAGGPRIVIKRDDQTGLATGGNKTRALEFLVGDALAQGADTLVTAGSAQSNHARQTAAAAARYGLRRDLVLRGQGPPDVNGNLLLDHVLGAHIHWSGDQPLGQVMRQVSDELRAAGRRPYTVPYGGSNELGILGYVAGIEELVTQIVQREIDLDRIVIASASGGQQAGLVLGKRALGLDIEITGIATEKRRADALSFMLELATSAATCLGLDLAFQESDFELLEAYLRQGYATPGEAEREAIQLLASTEGILVDPVYTGRALAGMLDLIRRDVIGPDETICFWHTGGMAGLFAWSEWLLARDIDRPIADNHSTGSGGTL
jgi:L-cysteate sulfo-lyase